MPFITAIEKHMQKMISSFKQVLLFQLFTIGLRYLLGASFVYASVFKIAGIRFTPESGKDAPINSLPHFFETMYQAGFYWRFIGWGQLIAGILLMSQIFSTIGAIAFFSILISIWVITFSFTSSAVLLITTLMLLGNIYLLLWDWNRIKYMLLPNPGNYVDDNHSFSKKKVWMYLGLVLFVAVICIRIALVMNMGIVDK
jgi:uncharacterized membrane protein YphA (DoxX/SURF4 family)